MATELEIVIATLSEKVQSHEERLRKHGEEIDEMRLLVNGLNVTLMRVDNTVSKIDAKLDELHKQPADKWNRLAWFLFVGVVGAAMAVVFDRIGLR